MKERQSRVVRHALHVARRSQTAMACVVGVLVAGCRGGSLEPGIDVNGPAIAVVTLTPSTLSLKSGLTQQFSVAFQPLLSDSRVVWSVTDTVSASITQAGLFTAKSPGKTTVTARSVLNVNTKGVAQVTVTQSP